MIGRPSAASELRKVFDDAYTVSHIDYHLALVKLDALQAAGNERVRGTVKGYYVLAAWARAPSTTPAKG